MRVRVVARTGQTERFYVLGSTLDSIGRECGLPRSAITAALDNFRCLQTPSLPKLVTKLPSALRDKVSGGKGSFYCVTEKIFR